MNIQDVKQDIKTKNIKSYYVFTGEEIEVQRVYINKIAEVLGYNVIRADSIADIWKSVTSPSIFSEYAVYVIRDDKELLTNDSLQSQIESGVIGKNVLIHLLTNVDKRTKWYKSNADKIVDFERLSDSILMKYVQREITLNKSVCERFIAICENDYSRLLLEIAKIRSYMQVNADLTADEAFEQLVADGTIYTPPKDAIFDLVDAILKRDVPRVYDMLYQSYAVGEANMVILSVLYNNTKQVLQVQACESSDIVNSTGLTSWQVKCAKDKCGYYTIGELVTIMELIQKIQKGIILGEIEDKLSVEYLLVQIL